MKYFKKIMKENINKIKKCKLFNRIKEDELEALLSCLNAKLIKYDKKRYIKHKIINFVNKSIGEFWHKKLPRLSCSLALNVPTCFASKNFVLFAKALRTLLACAGLKPKLVLALTRCI